MLAVLFGAAVASIQGQNQATPNQQAEVRCDLTDTDYAVFTALIKGLGGPEDPEEAWAGKDLLILDVTREPGSSISDSGRMERGWGFRSKSNDAPSHDTAVDFVAKSASKCLLSPRFVEGKPYSLLSEDVVIKTFKKGQDGWGKFYKLYPKAAGYWSFSRPGYNATGDEALVYVGHHCGWLCGTGHLYLLRKQDGNWAVMNRQMLWIS